MSPYFSKPGPHGTLYRWRITYHDDPAGPSFTCGTWAYDREHAEDNFYDSPDCDGWRIDKIERVRNAAAC